MEDTSVNRTAKKAKYQNLLEELFLFRNVPREEVEAVYCSPDCECVEFLPGEMVFTRNQYRRSLGVVVSGELRATKKGANSVIILNSFSQGGVFGAAGLFSDMEGYVSEIQAIRKSKVLFLPEEMLHSLFMRMPVAAENYIRYLSGRIRFLNNRIDSFTGGSAERRVAVFLLDAASKAGKADIRLAITFTDLAESLNIGRASLYRAMDSLVKAGLISRKAKEISILNVSGLREKCF